MNIADLDKYFRIHKEALLFHRYITFQHISSLLEKHRKVFDIKIIGQSVLGAPIHVIIIGTGKRNVLLWSQMHGNESTTTKAIFDLCNLFSESKNADIDIILKACTIAIVPILNPDGAEAYTRFNANQVDLNRDAQDLSQPESRVLRSLFNEFQPDFCFNLHGQRTIFSAGKTNYPATISFLAPAQDENCTVTSNRKRAMEIIVTMQNMLQQQIPNQVGIYDDTFNINCVGDTFQSLNVPTILFEAGHYANDYGREITRQYMFQSMLTAIHYIATNEIKGIGHESYFEIPQNEKLFYDIIIKNAVIGSNLRDIGIQYQEKLINGKIEFIPKVEKIGNLRHFYGHKEIEANKNEVYQGNTEPIEEGIEIDFVLVNMQHISLIL